MPLMNIYKPTLALLTDLYQLTMAYGYWKSGRHDWEAAFHLFYRKNPFAGGYAIFCGLAFVADYLRHFRFDESDLAYLEGLKSDDGRPLFDAGFLDYLKAIELTCDIDAPPEGTVVFPHQPLLRVKGPLIQCQLLETALLNMVNFQTLAATKSARVALATQGDPVLEFGLRRAQGVDGGLSASYAAYAGGAAATSNVLAGKLFGIPVKGTHAHSWVMSFEDEQTAFEVYAEAMPHNCVFLVDTYDTLAGVRRAIDIGRKLRDRGYRLLGVRLDSGDLAELSRQARNLLDEAGFAEARIVASNDLDELAIADLKARGARIDIWGVGTKLATAYDQPALGGVYKLGAIREPGHAWRPKLKLSEEPVKISNPGVLQTRRFLRDGRFMGDVIYDAELGLANPADAEPLMGALPRFASGDEAVDLLRPLFRAGKLVAEPPPLSAVRERTAAQLACLDEGCKRLRDPAAYPLALERRLADLKQRLAREAGG